MKKFFLVILLLNVYARLLAQGVGINADGSVAHPSAILDIKSSTKGLLIPRTSTTTRLSILNGANGLMLYDTTIGSFWFMNGGVWLESGRMDLVNSNTFFGYQSGRLFPVGDFNTGFGLETLYNNTTGLGNTSLGTSSMHSNTTGNNNMSAGMFSLYFNTTGSGNTAIGNNALILNQTGYSNVAVGISALFHNTTGQNIVAIGDSALFNSDNSFNNTAVGSKALFSAISGGSGNTALGKHALYAITTGDDNTAVGYGALVANSTGNSNVAIGNGALASTSGDRNVAVGDASMLGINSGSYNVAVGADIVIPGSHCTVLGSQVVISNAQYSTAIGSSSSVSCSNCMALGGDGVSSRTKVGINNASPATDLDIIQQTDAGSNNGRGIRLQRPNGNQWRVFLDPGSNYVFQYNNNVYAYIEPTAGLYINASDIRLKKDISSMDQVLDKLLLLQPKTYHYIASSDANRTSWGFLAQDVERLFPDFVFSSENGMKGIAYSNFSVIAVKAIQEQQQVIEGQKQKLDQQQQQIESMLKRIELLEKRNQP